MADVLIKSTNLVSSCNYHCKSEQNKVKSGYVVARSCRIKGFGLRVKSQGLRSEAVCFNGEINKKRFLLHGNEGKVNEVKPFQALTRSQSGLGLRLRAQNWWEKGLQPNMKEVTSAQDLADSLLNAGDKLVILDFFSPGCGGCRALHPKICQIAEMNPDVQFLQVNYEEHKSMCYSLNVHVLPFFRFYRGAHGRLCSFSCTNATIKKFKDALAKHSTDRCSLGPTKGLEEKELIALANNKDLKFTYTPKPEQPQPLPTEQQEVPAMARSHSVEHLPLPLPTMTSQESADKALITSGR